MQHGQRLDRSAGNAIRKTLDRLTDPGNDSVAGLRIVLIDIRADLFEMSQGAARDVQLHRGAKRDRHRVRAGNIPGPGVA
ncbi:hypothetical protein MKK75_21415 [Methylobacterium sp. J-030]|uniref:hypothetical protein n=1 Tax=Methylobacterium sp. J-030 TaxID=2836627 RepID=UPI001FB8C4D9|nr:hypothetical protein [Methylobacterium sp. J-030]MCJ2071320.1 hypothetical protein [Methylobacterium sp. J-030]